MVLLVLFGGAAALANWAATTWVTPRRLPRLDFSGRVPQDMRTLVVVPSMLGSNDDIEALLEGLEVCFLGNRDPRVHFGLLTDLCDAHTELRDDDTERVAQVSAGIQRLIDRKNDFDVAFACDTDHERHAIVTPGAGLVPPNHYLCVKIDFLFRNRPSWDQNAAIGKTVVTTALIDRIANRLRSVLVMAAIRASFTSE
jgi:hypothetical protein